MASRWMLCAIALVLLAAGPPVASHRVVKIVDGDSLWVLTPEGKELEVRLGEIDTPERDQPYAVESRAQLASLAARKYVRLEIQDVDQHGRTVARIYVGSLDVSAEMVSSGAAWAYRKYLRDQRLLALEKEARAAKRGLWALPESQRIPPWKWRRSHSRRQAPPPAPSPSSDFTCGAKTRCAEMSSCEEARFYLERCGATTIDGDGNGIPCEAICR